MKEKITKPYGNIYFEKNLPKNCGECPFQYDGMRCNALEYLDKPDELDQCLKSAHEGSIFYADYMICDRRYSKCPLKLKRKTKKENLNDKKRNT